MAPTVKQAPPRKTTATRQEAREVVQQLKVARRALTPVEHVVRIYVNRSVQPAQVRCDPDVVTLDWTRGDEIKWMSEEDTAYVHFPQTPFKRFVFLMSPENPIRSGAMVPDRIKLYQRAGFHYSVGVLSGEALPLDPVVIFEPDPTAH